MPRSETMETLQVPYELEQMVALYRKRRPKRVLEIGSWDGGTLKVWLENGVPALTLTAVDLEHRNSDCYEEWRQPNQTIQLHVGSSSMPDGVEFIRAHGPYDWLFVDGDHGPAGVRADVAVCREMAATGALMLLHDITPPSGTNSYPPGDVFDELQTEGFECWAFQDLTPAPWSRGIGVVQL